MTDTRTLTNAEYIAHMRQKRGKTVVNVNVDEPACPKCGLLTGERSEGFFCIEHGIFKPVRTGKLDVLDGGGTAPQIGYLFDSDLPSLAKEELPVWYSWEGEQRVDMLPKETLEAHR